MIRIFAGTIFSSAFLLFLVQPIVSKNILPWFGGSAAVWAVCMVFFQVVLLAGYAYSDWVTRSLKPRTQVVLHAVLLVASLAALPVMADASWKPTGREDPTWWILLLLVATVGLPYFLLSTTGPLIQAWVSKTLVDARVYRLFSLSNLASIIALICYPFLIEPYAALVTQANVWSMVYGLFVVLCVASGFHFYRHAGEASTHANEPEPIEGTQPTAWTHLMWLSLSAMGSWTLVAVTNHMTQNVAAIPFLWLLPLTLYLLTFVFCFESDSWYSRRRFLLPTAAMIALCAYGLQDGEIGGTVKVAIPVYAGGLFLACMFLHGELAAMRPGTRWLTRFYLMVSLGGAIGGIVVAMIAPRVLPAYYELGIGFVVIALLASRVLRARHGLVVGSLALAAFCAWSLQQQVASDFKDARRVERNFYGTLLTVDVKRENAADSVRQLYHGSVKHGEQFLDASRRGEPTTYYGPTSGIGLAIRYGGSGENRRIGLIGLGAGTLAVYGKAGDIYRFYEINPDVVTLAQDEFSFMRDSAAKIETVVGDARLILECEAPNGFDVLAVDAFSGDSIPVHLITREAMAIYLRHIKPDGIVAFHVTNRFLSLAPVVERLASDQGAYAVQVRDPAEGVSIRTTDWVLVAKDRSVLERPGIREAAKPIEPVPGARPWTDDFNNLFEVMK